MTHLKEPQQALGVLVIALEDPLTHIGWLSSILSITCTEPWSWLIVCRPRLIRRLVRIEKKLRIPPDQYIKCDIDLRNARIRVIRGTRVSILKPSESPSSTPLVSGENLRLFTASRSPFETHRESKKVPQVRHQTGQHSLWLGKTGAEIGVEEFALEHYATLGFRGYVISDLVLSL